MSEPCGLYRHFDADGTLLYVGVSNNPKRRLWEHKSRAVWAEEIDDMKVQWHPTREAALQAEREAIRSENPIFNGGSSEPVLTGDVFRDWLATTGRTQAQIADDCGFAASTMSQLVTGKRRVPLRFAAYIEDISEGVVPMRYWLFGASAEPQKKTAQIVLIASGDAA